MSLIAPSILNSDFLHLNDTCDMLNASKADWFHLDVMDGSFVPNISFGLPIVEHVKKVAKKPLDVHLMIVEPEKYIEDFKKAGANVLTVHYETSTHLHRSIEHIKSVGMKAGVAINPHTSVHLLENVINIIDVVCVMSVNPGFGGQQFIPQTINKIRTLKKLIHDAGSQTLIEVDGGVTLDNAHAILHSGADVLVVGSTIFKSNNPMQTIELLKKI